MTLTVVISCAGLFCTILGAAFILGGKIGRIDSKVDSVQSGLSSLRNTFDDLLLERFSQQRASHRGD